MTGKLWFPKVFLLFRAFAERYNIREEPILTQHMECTQVLDEKTKHMVGFVYQ